MADDAGTKQDKPTDQEGKGATQAKAEVETKAATEAAATEAAATDAAEEKPKPKPRRKPAAKKAEGTAAAKTDVDKDAAEAGAEGAEAPKKPAKKAAARQPEAAAAPKPAKRPAGDRVTVSAHAKYVRTSARKARLVTDHIKGKTVQEAQAVLAFHPRSVAEDWRKLLNSAVANAEHNHDLVGDDLRVLNATADEGPTLKRFRPRAMGRATRIRKRTSHLSITLTPKES